MTIQKVKTSKNIEATAWRFMRLSGFLIIPLVWFHVLLQDVIVGVHAMDIDYVAERLANLGWKIFDILLLAFAFAHGMNGVRQVANDFIHTEKGQLRMARVLLVVWVIVSIIGAVAVIAGARPELA